MTWSGASSGEHFLASNPPTLSGSALVAGIYYMPPPTGADDGPTLQAVLNTYALKSNPSVRIVYGAGTFRFSTTVTVPRVGATNRTVSVVIEGAGYMQDGFFQTNPDGTIWLAVSLAGDLLTTNTTGNTFCFVSLEKLTISANPTMGGSQSSGHLVHLWALQEGTIRDVEVEYAFADGIRIESITGIVNCDILSIDHCRIEHCGANGIAILGEIQGVIHGATHIESCNVGIAVGTTSDQCAIIGVSIQGCTLQGIQGGPRDIRIIGNVINISGHEGIQLLGATRPIVIGNTCTDNGSANIDPRGIRLFNTTGARVQGNICTDTGTGNQRHGFSEEGTSDNNDISGNDFSGNVTAAVNSVVGASTVLRNNKGYNPQGVAAISVTASPFTYTAGPTPEVVYIVAGTVSLIVKNVVTLGTGTSATVPIAVPLEPHEAVVVTYSVAPTMNKDRK